MLRLAIFALVTSASLASAADLPSLFTQIKSVGVDAKNASAAATAWSELKAQTLNAVVPTLTAFDGASPLAVNWLRSALDAIIERETKAGHKLAIADLEAFLRDTKHSAAGRRMAFELICQADPTALARWLPNFLNDPAPELRYDAVDSAFAKVRKLPKPDPAVEEEKKPDPLAKDPAAIAELQKLLASSRHFGQTAEIGRELEAYGEKVDLTQHFGYIKKWRIIAAFDNTNEKGFAAVYPPEQKLDSSGAYPGKDNKTTTWITVDSKEQFATVDLNKHVGKVKNAVAYAFAEVEADAAQDIELRAASATGIKIFCNGKEIFAAQTYHQSFTPDTHVATAHLNKGKNTILVKVCQNDQKEQWAQDWKFQMRACDATGVRVPLKKVTP